MEGKAKAAAQLCEEFAEHLYHVLTRQPALCSARNAVAYALLISAVEHFRAMVCLVDAGIYGSAFTLARSQFEAVVRGSWMAYCAEDRQVGRFRDSDNFEFPTFSSMIEALKASPCVFAEELGEMKANGYKKMNDFTHGGRLAVIARIEGGEVGERFSDAEAADMLAMTAAIAGAAATAILQVSEAHHLALQVLERIDPLQDRIRALLAQ